MPVCLCSVRVDESHRHVAKCSLTQSVQVNTMFAVHIDESHKRVHVAKCSLTQSVQVNEVFAVHIDESHKRACGRVLTHSQSVQVNAMCSSSHYLGAF